MTYLEIIQQEAAERGYEMTHADKKAFEDFVKHCLMNKYEEDFDMATGETIWRDEADVLEMLSIDYFYEAECTDPYSDIWTTFISECMEENGLDSWED